MNISTSLLSHVECIESLFECDAKIRIQPQPQQNAIDRKIRQNTTSHLSIACRRRVVSKFIKIYQDFS